MHKAIIITATLIVATGFFYPTAHAWQCSGHTTQITNANDGCNSNDDFASWALPTALGESKVNPNTGLTVTKITDEGGCAIDYVRKINANRTGQYIWVRCSTTGHSLVDLTTGPSYSIREAPHNSSTPYLRSGSFAEPDYWWDMSGNHDNRIYWTYGWELYRGEADYTGNWYEAGTRVFNFRTATSDPPNGFGATDAPLITQVHMHQEGSGSQGRYVTYSVHLSNSTTPKYVVTFDVVTESIIAVALRTALAGGDVSYNFVDTAPNNLPYISWEDYRTIYCSTYNTDLTVQYDTCAQSAHSGWAYDPEGNVVSVQINSCIPSPYSDWLAARSTISGNLNYRILPQCWLYDTAYTTNTCTSPEYLGHHFGRFENGVGQGWLMLNVYGTSGWAGTNIMMVKIEDLPSSPTVWRVIDTRNSINSYDAPNGDPSDTNSISYDGSRLFFTSDNGDTDEQEVYMVELPSNWWGQLNTGGVDTTPPTLSEPLPTGAPSCPSDPRDITISINCADASGCTECKADTTNTDFDSMAISLSQEGTTWSAAVSDLPCASTYSYNAICKDAAGNESDAATVSFSISDSSGTGTGSGCFIGSSFNTELRRQ